MMQKNDEKFFEIGGQRPPLRPFNDLWEVIIDHSLCILQIFETCGINIFSLPKYRFILVVSRSKMASVFHFDLSEIV